MVELLCRWRAAMLRHTVASSIAAVPVAGLNRTRRRNERPANVNLSLRDAHFDPDAGTLLQLSLA
jgi:hypothetical protein